MLFSGLCVYYPSVVENTKVCCPEKTAVVQQGGRCVESTPEGRLKHCAPPIAFCLIAVTTSDQDKSVLGSSVLRRKLCNRKNIW